MSCDSHNPACCPPLTYTHGTARRSVLMCFILVYFTLIHTEVAGGRSDRFRNHSIGSSSGFEASRGRSQTAPLCFLFREHLRLPHPHLQSSLASGCCESTFRCCGERLFPRSGVFTPVCLLPRLRQLSGSDVSRVQRKERTQQAQDSQMGRSGVQEDSHAATAPLPPPRYSGRPPQ